MSLPSYTQLHGKFLAESSQIKKFPADTFYSIPVCLKRADTLYDAFFIYSYPEDKKSKTNRGFQDPMRPFAWGTFAAKGTGENSFNWCSFHDFVSEDSFPLGQTVAGALPSALSMARYQSAFEDAIDAYEKIRLYAFHQNTTVTQLELIAAYKTAFTTVVPEGLYPFYYALSPEFFNWMRFPMPTVGVQKPKHSPVEEAVSELKELSKAVQQELYPLRRLEAFSSQQEIISDQHGELQRYRNGLLEELTLPVERDVVMIIDAIESHLEVLEQSSPTKENFSRLLSLFRGIQQDLTDLLYRQGVDPYTVPGTAVTVSKQRVIHTVPTTDKALDKTVAQRLNGGWQKGEHIVRPEYVSAYLYQPDPPTKKAPSRKENKGNTHTKNNSDSSESTVLPTLQNIKLESHVSLPEPAVADKNNKKAPQHQTMDEEMKRSE